MRRKQPSTEIYSIYGQIEAVVAAMMCREGKMQAIPQSLIPPTALYRESDRRKAHFAVIVPREYQTEFEQRIRELRA